MVSSLLIVLALTAAQQPGNARQQATAFLQKGDQLKEAKKYEEALKAYGSAVDRDPDLVRAHLQRAWIFNELGRHTEAIRECNFIVSVVGEADDPATRGTALRERGYARLRLQRTEEAIADLSQAIRLEPNNALGYSYRADAYVDQEDYRKALPDAQQYLRMEPDAVSAYNRVGRILVELRRYDEALAAINKAIQRNGNYAAAYANRGYAHLKQQKQLDAALADLNRAIQLDGNVAWYYEMRGRVYAALGNASAAADDADKARRLKMRVAPKP